MKPTPVAVNNAKVDLDEFLDRTTEVCALTVFNLGRYFNPKPLFLRIVEVDKLCKEENDCCSPEHCGRRITSRRFEGDETDLPTAKP